MKSPTITAMKVISTYGQIVTNPDTPIRKNFIPYFGHLKV
jgi:hypothetical protein